MPDKDFVSKALESAKSALAGAKKFSASAGDSEPGRFAPKPAMSKPTPKPAPVTGLAKDASDVNSGLKWRAEQVKALGSFKKGGTVPKTGVYKLHEGEQVIPAEIMDKATSALGGPKKMKKKLHMNIEPTDDDRFHVMHSYSGGDKTEPMMENTKHAPSSLAELLEHVKNHYGEEKEPAEKDGPAS